MTHAPVHQTPLFFQRLFEAAPHPYLILEADPAFTILAVNDRYLEATGTRREIIVGHGLFEVFPDNPSESGGTAVSDLRTSLGRVLGDRRPDIMGVQKYDIPLRDGSGGFEVRYWSPVNSPVTDEEGRVAWIIHHVEDVTDFILGRERDRRVTAEALGTVEARPERMEAEVLHRAAEVKGANRALKTALEELERREAELARLNGRLQELDRLKNDFFANISHELRTPLTLILGPLEHRLAQSGLEPELRQDLERMERNARLLLARVNDLLDLAKLDAGRMGLQLRDSDLAYLVRLEVSRFESLAEERGLDFTAAVPDALPLRVDPEKVRRLLANLLSNAFKFTPDGGWIRVRLERRAEDVILEVSDSGPGVPEPLRAVVFDRFRQVEGGGDRAKGGTGLGLAIAKEFAELHGGSVALGAAPGGGARFRAVLPFRAPEGGPFQPAEAAGPEVPELLDRRPAPDAVLPGAREPDAPVVLVVEDNPDMRAFLVSALARSYRVRTAANGAEGLSRALADPPDLVLSDVMMPGMAGDRMVEELRRHPELDGVPVVLLTAKADEALRVKMLHLGVGDYLFKPFSMDELLARVGALVAERCKGLTARRLQEARFQAALELDAAMMDNVSMGIYLVDGRAGTILRANHGLHAMFGYAPGELAGRPVAILNASGEGVPGEVALCLSRERTWTGEVLSRRSDGSPFWTLVAKAAFHHADLGEVWVAARQDITERKQAERKIRSLQADLERRVRERTAELEAANGELESFASAVSHDLRAPLRAMSGFSMALVEDLGPRLEEKERIYLEQINQASLKMAALIEGLLHLSRATRGDLRREWVDLSALAGQVRQELVRSEPGRAVTWEVAEGLMAWGDPRLLETLVGNLLGNAWKYTRHTVPATIRLQGEVLGQTARFTVADNGAGFDMAHAAKLYQPFQRLHRQDEFPGLGIGLATVQRIVNRHGGAIEAQAWPGLGASFSFTLPNPEAGEAPK